MPAKSLLRDLDALLRSIELPEGIRWLDDDLPSCLLARGQTYGHLACFVSWLLHFTPATGPEGQGVRMYVWRISIPLTTSLMASMDEEHRAAFWARIQEEIAGFQAALAAGTAIEIQDGENLP